MTATLIREMPKRLRTRPRDRRGYPIPFIVMIDKEGRPHFTINTGIRVAECFTKKLCGLCGKRHDPGGVWFVGGSRCFTDPNGRFLDPPMHEDCARYALRVCPYLAAPSYPKRIDARTLKPDAVPEAMEIVSERGMAEARPDIFMLGRAITWLPEPLQDDPRHLCFMAREWLHLETWQGGQMIGMMTGEKG